MGYINELGIKNVSGIEKFIIKECGITVAAVKTASHVKIFWCANNKLMQHELNACVVYVIKTDDLLFAVKTINKSLR
jgi:ABC-type antimicrobial peptide transport system permease subunit